MLIKTFSLNKGYLSEGTKLLIESQENNTKYPFDCTSGPNFLQVAKNFINSIKEVS